MKKKMMSQPKPVLAGLKVIARKGDFALVHGVFPEGTVRSSNVTDYDRAGRMFMRIAKNTSVDSLIARRGTTVPAYAVVSMTSVELTKNEYGDVHP